VALAAAGGFQYFGSKVTARADYLGEKVRKLEAADPLQAGTGSSSEYDLSEEGEGVEAILPFSDGLDAEDGEFVEDPDSVTDEPSITGQHKRENYDNVKYGKIAGFPFVKGKGHATAVHPADVSQGQIADCYFMAALAAVAAGNPATLRRNLRGLPGNYDKEALKKGAKVTDKFAVKLFKGGKWVTYQLDDRFPVNKRGKPLYARPGQTAGKYGLPELWPMLYERAYAKANGNYTAIGNGGEVADAMRMLTGQPSTTHTPSKMTIQKLDAFVRAKYAVAAGTPEKSDGALFKDDTLATWHTYWVESVDVKRKTVTLRNPWGYSRGPIEVKWSDFKKSFDAVTTNPIYARKAKK
jgi:hypothetical protein